MGKAEKKAQAMKDCAAWNRAHPIGTKVTVTDRNTTFISRTTSAATSFGFNTAMVWVEGHGESFALSKVKPVEEREEVN